MPSTLLLGAIADDVTGGSDMAGMLACEGVRTVQTFGIPDAATLSRCDDAEAIVVSLKTRSVPAAEAVQRSLAAIRTLDAKQIQFKYCSTFDSTAAGNIGPVTSALMDELGTNFTIAVPALPVNGRTQYFGHLFVNGVPLAESHMRHHPLNPMTDSNLVRHLQAQTTRPSNLIDLPSLRAGHSSRSEGIALVDAIDDSDLGRIAHAFTDLPLITGGSGISRALPAAWREKIGWRPSPARISADNLGSRKALLLAGSCSDATLRQIAVWRQAGMPLHRLDEDAAQWCIDSWRTYDAVLVYSSAPASERTAPPEQIEAGFAALASALHGKYERLIVAGGETSGAVIEALHIHAVSIGDAIDPGVPALRALGEQPFRLALKSGNFGAPEFFAKALKSLE